MEKLKCSPSCERCLPIAEPQIGEDERANLLDAFDSTWISSIGKYITLFEDQFSAYCGKKYGVSTSNGTTALHLALTALGIGPGDEVIVPDITFAATVNSVLYVGATPVIVDIEEDSWCIDPYEVEHAITNKTKAIIPVHIYGQACDMMHIMQIAEKHHLFVVEDCAEAHGAEFAGKKVGSFGIISCFSFFGNKIITTGEGGMCLTNDEELNRKMRVLRDHGMNKEFKYYHDCVGFNYRMTNLQAAIGVAQLADIENKIKWRRELELNYKAALACIPEIHFQKDDFDDRKKVCWLVTVFADNRQKRDDILKSMKNSNIDARPFFVPLSRMKIYSPYVKSNHISNKMSEIGFNLPTSYQIHKNEINRVVKAISDGLDTGSERE